MNWVKLIICIDNLNMHETFRKILNSGQERIRHKPKGGEREKKEKEETKEERKRKKRRKCLSEHCRGLRHIEWKVSL